MKKISRKITLVLCLLAVASCTSAPRGPGQAEHVVLVIWDGLRPDSVTENNTPNLFHLAQRGVTFTRHHAVYPSSTEVNGTAIATGVYPMHSGIMGNKEFRPGIEARSPIATENLTAVRAGDAAAGGRYLLVPTLTERLQNQGFFTAVAGTKPVALLYDRAARADSANAAPTLFAGQSLPESLAKNLARALGPFPTQITFPNFAQDLWTTRALTEELWKNHAPEFSVLWLSDPDYTQHDSAPGAASALAALTGSDANLGRVLDALATKNQLEKTDIFVVSDHGFSTIEQSIDLAAILTQAGFPATRRFLTPPASGEIMVVSNGGSVFLYVTQHDPAVTRRLVEFLQSADFAGVIFTREPMPGTFTLRQGLIDTADAPDIVVALRWSEKMNPFGFAGAIIADIGRRTGQGSHATLSRSDMHNTLIAAGPDFLVGAINPLPSGNTDLAPTMAWIFGLPENIPFDGRVLFEALQIPAEKKPRLSAKIFKMETSAPGGSKIWRQYLQVEQVGHTLYFDEGNGAAR